MTTAEAAQQLMSIVATRRESGVSDMGDHQLHLCFFMFYLQFYSGCHFVSLHLMYLAEEQSASVQCGN